MRSPPPLAARSARHSDSMASSSVGKSEPMPRRRAGARDRVGGRCYTSDGVDYGAHWIHGTEGNPITNLARELGIGTLFVGGDSAYSGGWDQLVLHGPDGKTLTAADKLRSILIADEVRDELDADRRRHLREDGVNDCSLQDA